MKKVIQLTILSVLVVGFAFSLKNQKPDLQTETSESSNPPHKSSPDDKPVSLEDEKSETETPKTNISEISAKYQESRRYLPNLSNDDQTLQDSAVFFQDYGIPEDYKLVQMLEDKDRILDDDIPHFYSGLSLNWWGRYPDLEELRRPESPFNW